MSDIDLYATLGVPRSASKDEIRKAYRTIVQKCHPDKSEEVHDVIRFHRVQYAYDVLMDDYRRVRYDATGDTKKPDLNALALEELGKLALQVVEQFNTDHTDIVSQMRHIISTAQDDLRVKCLEQQQDIRRRMRVVQRLVRKGDNIPNILQVSLERDISTREARLEETKVKISQATRMLEILAGYHYQLN